jgi:hypothetical protein
MGFDGVSAALRSTLAMLSPSRGTSPVGSRSVSAAAEVHAPVVSHFALPGAMGHEGGGIAAWRPGGAVHGGWLRCGGAWRGWVQAALVLMCKTLLGLQQQCTACSAAACCCCPAACVQQPPSCLCLAIGCKVFRRGGCNCNCRRQHPGAAAAASCAGGAQQRLQHAWRAAAARLPLQQLHQCHLTDDQPALQQSQRVSRSRPAGKGQHALHACEACTHACMHACGACLCQQQAAVHASPSAPLASCTGRCQQAHAAPSSRMQPACWPPDVSACAAMQDELPPLSPSCCHPSTPPAATLRHSSTA